MLLEFNKKNTDFEGPTVLQITEKSVDRAPHVAGDRPEFGSRPERRNANAVGTATFWPGSNVLNQTALIRVSIVIELKHCATLRVHAASKCVFAEALATMTDE